MLSAGGGVATIDMYMNYNMKPKTSPEESHSDRIVKEHSLGRKNKHQNVFAQTKQIYLTIAK